MRYLGILLFSGFIGCNLLALHDNNKSEKNGNHVKKELEKRNSKSTIFNKLKKKASDNGVREIRSYQDMVNAIDSNDYSGIKNALLENNDLIFLANDHQENIVFYMASQNKFHALHLALSLLKPDTALQAINLRNPRDMGALHIAIQQHARESAVIMLLRGAFVDLPGPANVTPYVMALNNQDSLMASILVSFGALVKVAPFGKGRKLIEAVRLLTSQCKEYIGNQFAQGPKKIDDAFIKAYERKILDIQDQVLQSSKDDLLQNDLQQYVNQDNVNSSVKMIDQLLSEINQKQS